MEPGELKDSPVERGKRILCAAVSTTTQDNLNSVIRPKTASNHLTPQQFIVLDPRRGWARRSVLTALDLLRLHRVNEQLAPTVHHLIETREGLTVGKFGNDVTLTGPLSASLQDASTQEEGINTEAPETLKIHSSGSLIVGPPAV